MSLRQLLFRAGSMSTTFLAENRTHEFRKIYEEYQLYVRKTVFWIYRIAINTSLSFLRKNKGHRGVQSFEDGIIPSKSKVSDPLLEKLIAKGINQLEEKLKITFILFYKQELSVTEIAEILEIPEGSVKSRLHSGRNIFKSFLLKHGVTYERG